MTCNPDLTTAGALSPPVSAAAMRADKVDPRAFEGLLRAAARRLEERRHAATLPRASIRDQGRRALRGPACTW